MQLEEILSELENNTGKFPRLALERAIQEQEAITPLLLATLEESKNNLEDLLEEPDYFLHIYSLFLLAQFRESKSYPIIVDFFSTPGDISLDVTGDVVTEDLGRILASISHGNLDPIKQLVENPAVNKFVRGAALKSLVILLVQKIISREQVVQYFEELFLSKLEKDNSHMWNKLVINSCDICAIELKEHIDRAFEEDLMERFFVNENNVNNSLEMGVEAALQKLHNKQHYTLINDTILEMESWNCFLADKPNKKDNSPISVKGFTLTLNKNKSQVDKKKKMQKESRRKNRSKKG
ncbi:DUF1186 family protein [Anabaena cylindrica FACHB-243]|uniref:DUF1186 domain-containing protein n=1 Tax=Anabaena cylindrica (strain ATCC 27899 / PCC 7122) TaxID=272123 RepID=K9ZDD0_ANACC|nr:MULTISPECIES: DUF1186 domain-containing protein [Anabaena]AFZ56729.1 protein of unknown function DUF1186 [Anabaena cylindrica PCC 7122]MBD2417996.1 DUF1186 family protein [Anabaena cylindrica FACHB-243]MBY5284521.1 DUF1186 domain-containing protein [Anabaena sp. CCAP 1446/1C]MBY5310949.1 DUF1186 domain-containing protein [Anabaena sp. CCAP 1446/1C]MCM2409473.1 DUF1186 family protein [Anabaena sp. CCAP 1446/1C]